MDVILLIVDQSEGRHRSGTKPEIALHTLLGGEGEFALMQTMLQVVNRQRAFAIEDHQIVAVALMVAEKEILAVLRAIGTPILARNLDGRCLGMLIKRVFDSLRTQKIEYLIASLHRAPILRLRHATAESTPRGSYPCDIRQPYHQRIRLHPSRSSTSHARSLRYRQR